jgi:ABC-type lipoprotein export system ATPase subunit
LTVSQVEAEQLASCEGVEVSYGAGVNAVRGLAGVTVQIHAHDSLALVGRSGSGKTTLLHALGGLIEVTAGTIEWRGRPLASLDYAARGAVRARGIAYVFQGANLLPNFTVSENVAFAAALAGGGSRGAIPGDEMLELVGMSTRADRLPSELSGGEAQRVAIARALVQQPDLLLCDEPTGHLDSDTAARVLDMIEALQARQGFALVIATHDFDVAARLRREIELEDGRIVREEAA